MREIKFRVWDGNSMMDLFDEFYEELAVDILTGGDDKYTVMQYTGLEDKAGVEIWEGDIIKCERPEEVWCFTGTVIWHDVGAIGWVFDEDGETGFWLNSNDCQYWEVIGNVFEGTGDE